MIIRYCVVAYENIFQQKNFTLFCVYIKYKAVNVERSLGEKKMCESLYYLILVIILCAYLLKGGTVIYIFSLLINILVNWGFNDMSI